MSNKIDNMNFKRKWLIFAVVAIIICVGAALMLYTDFSSRYNTYISSSQTTQNSSTQATAEKDMDGHHKDIDGFFHNTSLTTKDKVMIGTSGGLLLLLGICYWLLVLGCMIKQTRKDDANTMLFGLLTLFFNVAAVAAYFIYRGFAPRCPQCGKIQRHGTLFCNSCGAPVSKKCSSCGTKLKVSDNYCTKCGHAV